MCPHVRDDAKPIGFVCVCVAADGSHRHDELSSSTAFMQVSGRSADLGRRRGQCYISSRMLPSVQAHPSQSGSTSAAINKMHLLPTLLSLTALLAAALAQAGSIKNNTQEYHLMTKLKPNQRNKGRYGGLYLQTYHTGAGLSDAVLTKNKVRLPPRQRSYAIFLLTQDQGQIRRRLPQRHQWPLGKHHLPKPDLRLRKRLPLVSRPRPQCRLLQLLAARADQRRRRT